jgi:hypothetical protein
LLQYKAKKFPPFIKVTAPSGRASSVGGPEKIHNDYVIAPIEAQLKSADLRSKSVIFQIFLLRCAAGLAVLVHLHPI